MKDTVFVCETSVWSDRLWCLWLRSAAKGARLGFEFDISSRRFDDGAGLVNTSNAASCARRRMTAGEIVLGLVVDGAKLPFLPEVPRQGAVEVAV